MSGAGDWAVDVDDFAGGEGRIALRASCLSQPSLSKVLSDGVFFAGGQSPADGAFFGVQDEPDAAAFVALADTEGAILSM
ncbi:MAG: hypothetical protein R3C45_12075 [Phycisphaerales bacterium]